MVSALVVLTTGSEDLETVTCVDILRRGQVNVTLASLGETTTVVCQEGMTIIADKLLKDTSVSNFDAIVLPGGYAAALAFSSDAHLQSMLREFENQEKVIAALCASPMALAPAQVAKGKTVTSYPGCIADDLQTTWFKSYSEDRVVVDGNVITSRGPATASHFALSVVKKLKGVEVARGVAEPMLFEKGTTIVYSALVVLTTGSEDLETVTCVDILRRAQIKVTLASLGETTTTVVCQEGMTIIADKLLKETSVSDFDAIVLPGGYAAATAFSSDSHLHSMLREFERQGKVIAALCASPMALAPAQVAKGKTVTSYPGCIADDLQTTWFKSYSEDRVVVDGNVITSRGPATASLFALSVVKKLKGFEVAQGVAEPMLFEKGAVTASAPVVSSKGDEVAKGVAEPVQFEMKTTAASPPVATKFMSLIRKLVKMLKK
ncbi:hypothetical protein HDU98_008831 [Podochytrium sp. JEL0797]|nr:hypothetical protein HDU98_008831 [Podochytrium sp. JEL0797]